MTTLEIIFSVCGVLISLAAVFAGIGYYKQGKNQEKLDTSTTEVSSMELLEKKVQVLSDEVGRLTTEVHSLKEANELEKKKFVEALLMIQGKDTTMSDFVKTANEYMLLTAPTIDTLKRFLDKQII